MKKSFILHNDSLCVLEDLTNEQRGELFYAIAKYQEGIKVELSPIVKIAFSPFKNQFDRDLEKYQEFCKQQQEKGKKGGRPKKTNETQKTQRVYEKPKKAYKDSDSDKDNKNNKLEKTLEDFYDMRKKIKSPMTDRAKELLISKLETMSKGQEEIKILLLEQSIERGWKSIFELKEEYKPKEKVILNL